MKLFIPKYISDLKPYSPGKPLEELEREYGISDSVKIASNENPIGPSPMALKAIADAMARLNRYPDGGGHDLIKKISETLDVKPSSIVLGNGSDDIIGMLTRALLCPGDEAIIPHPSFLMYDIMVRSSGATPVYVPLESLSIDLPAMESKITSKTRMIFICNPNNPTGTIVFKKDFESFLESIPENIVVVVDEAYIEFVRDQNCASSIDYIDLARPVVTLRTFSKAYGLAGLRIGFGVMPEEVASVLNRVRQPFNANLLAQAGAIAAIKDKAFLEKTIKLVHDGLEFLYDSLDRIGVKYFPTESNFFLVDVGENADNVFEKMLRQGVIVRSMSSYGYPEYIRINVGLHRENIRFIKALETVLGKNGKSKGNPAGLLITIDGPAGAGKTTVSKNLAARLGYKYIDTGALYRGIALAALSAGINHDDDKGLEDLFKNLCLSFKHTEKGLRLMLNMADITDIIRTPEITQSASAISARPVVREFLLDLQRDSAMEKRVIFEGRDMGTVVFPDADIKFYLDATLETRALRRHAELSPTASQTLEDVKVDIKHRDQNDSSRQIAPLRAAEDAIKIDSTNLTADQVVNLMISHMTKLF